MLCVYLHACILCILYCITVVPYVTFPPQVSLSGAGMRLADIVCNASLLEQFLTVGEGDSMSVLQANLCAVDPDTLQQAEQLFLTQLDYSKIFTVRSHCLKPGCG